MAKKLKNIQIIAEFYGCKPDLISTSNTVKRIINRAVRKSKLTKIRSHYHQFRPSGVTGVVLLAESHITMHSWPEYNYIALDIFSCGDKNKALVAMQQLVKDFKPAKVKKKVVMRGL